MFHLENFSSADEAVKLKELNSYFKGVLQHRVLRGDKELFTFLFLQNCSKPGKTRYERFLSRLVDLSRQYLNKLLTREVKGRGDEEAAIHDYRELFAEQESNFRSFAALVATHLNAQICRYNIAVSCEEFPVAVRLEEKFRADEANALQEKSERLQAIFEEVRQAFKLRLLLREHIKELKANSIRSRYNSRYEHLDKVLEENRRKYEFWTRELLQELECNIVLVSTLVKELACGYYSQVQHLYSSPAPPH